MLEHGKACTCHQAKACIGMCASRQVLSECACMCSNSCSGYAHEHDDLTSFGLPDGTASQPHDTFERVADVTWYSLCCRKQDPNPLSTHHSQYRHQSTFNVLYVLADMADAASGCADLLSHFGACFWRLPPKGEGQQRHP